MNTAIRPRSVYWRRRAAVAAAGATGMIMLIHSCATGGPPHLQVQGNQAFSVPLTATYTPTPTPTLLASPSAAPTGVAAAAAVPGASSPVTSPPMAPTGVATPVATAPAKGGKHQALGAAPSPTAAAAAAPAAPVAAVAAAPGAAAIPGCAKSDLAVELRTDSTDYAGQAKPKFYIGVSNIGQNPCQVDLGSVALLFTVRSGPDRIWSSRDCQGKGTHDVRTLTPGQKLWGRSIWSKSRSKHGCPADEADAHPGTYTLEGSAAGVKAQKRIVFRIR